MQPGSTSRGSRSPNALLGAVGCLIVLGFCAMGAYVLAELRQDTLAATIRTSDNLLTAVAEDIARNVELYDLSLRGVIDGLSMPEIGSVSPRTRNAMLFDRAATARYLGAILVLDEAGNVVEDSGGVPVRAANLSDRDYYQVHAHGETGLFISRPFHRRVTGPDDLVIALSRPLRKPDGSFGGVVVGTMRLDYFRDLFDRFKVGKQGIVSLLRADGVILMRTPFIERLVGQDMSGSENFRRSLNSSSGTFSGRAVLDGVQRLYHYRRVGALPLLLHIGLAESEIYAPWWRRVMVISGILLGLCTAAGGSGLLFARELRRRTRAEQVMRESEAQYRLLAEHATDVIMRVDAGLRRQYVSPASLAVLGYRPDELVGGHPAATTHPDDWPDLERLSHTLQANQGAADATYRIRHAEGHWVWIEAKFSYLPSDGGYAVVMRDVTRRKQAQQKLEATNSDLVQQAVTDTLTGLLNRRGLDDAFEAEWRNAIRNRTPLSLVLLDVDRFKLFNDRYGHPAGDACLKALAAVIQRAAQRPGDVAARYGGEEFALLLPGAAETAAAAIAETLRAGIRQLGIPHAGNAEMGGMVTASLGVASIDPAVGRPLSSMQDLLSSTDRALYHAKHAGRDRVACAIDLPPGPVPDLVAPGVGPS